MLISSRTEADEVIFSVSLSKFNWISSSSSSFKTQSVSEQHFQLRNIKLLRLKSALVLLSYDHTQIFLDKCMFSSVCVRFSLSKNSVLITVSVTDLWDCNWLFNVSVVKGKVKKMKMEVRNNRCYSEMKPWTSAHFWHQQNLLKSELNVL